MQPYLLCTVRGTVATNDREEGRVGCQGRTDGDGTGAGASPGGTSALPYAATMSYTNCTHTHTHTHTEIIMQSPIDPCQRHGRPPTASAGAVPTMGSPRSLQQQSLLLAEAMCLGLGTNPHR